MNTIRMKAPIKYQLLNYRHTVLIMYLCVYFFTALISIPLSFKFSGSTSGLELASAITIFVIGLNSFKDIFKFFSANGVSRKTQFLSTAASLGILSAVLALIDMINCIIFTHLTTYSPMFLQIYGPRFGFGFSKENPILTPQILLEFFLWLIFLYFFVSMIGLFITTLYYRMNKGLKIAVSIAVPTVLLNGISALDFYFLNGKISDFLENAAKTAWGISNGFNPYIGMVSMFFFAAAFAALAFLLARKATVKE
jgi:hypothetical protein